MFSRIKADDNLANPSCQTGIVKKTFVRGLVKNPLSDWNSKETFERGIIQNPLSDWNSKENHWERNSKESFVGLG